MKTDIHPAYHDTNVTCSCGNQFTTRSTVEGDLHVELCSQCHPFYTGKQKLVDTGGRVERFKKRYAGFEQKKAEQEAKKRAEAEERAAQEAAEKAKAEAEPAPEAESAPAEEPEPAPE